MHVFVGVQSLRLWAWNWSGEKPREKLKTCLCSGLPSGLFMLPAFLPPPYPQDILLLLLPVVPKSGSQGTGCEEGEMPCGARSQLEPPLEMLLM